MTHHMRLLCFLASAACYIAWLTDLSVPSSAAGSPVYGAVVAVTARPSERPTVLNIRRDPFSSAKKRRVTASAASAAVDESRLPSDDTTVPDISGSLAPVAAPQGAAETSYVLRATIVGNPSIAYIETGSAINIVRIGGTIGGRKLVKIALDSVLLDDGTRLEMVEGVAATPKPRAASVDSTLERLRHLLATFGQRKPAATLPSAVSTGATPQSVPTPAPLPTVNPNGLIPGNNPAYPGGPTPYPIYYRAR